MDSAPHTLPPYATVRISGSARFAIIVSAVLTFRPALREAAILNSRNHPRHVCGSCGGFAVQF